MSTNTEILDLFKYDPVEDANNTFNITESMNNNWDKLDNKISITEYDSNVTYKSGLWVKNGDKLYKSLQDNNTGHATSEGDWWEKVSDDNKLNVDADNLSAAGKEIVASLSFPGFKYENLSLGASNQKYPAKDYDRYIFVEKKAGVSNGFINISVFDNAASFLYTVEGNPNLSTDVGRAFAKVPAGCYFQVGYNLTGSTNNFREFKPKGYIND